MRIASLLSLDSIEEKMGAVDGREALASLASLLVAAGRIPEGTDIVGSLESREELGSTGIGNGVAIPHVRLKEISSFSMALGRSVGGVDFNAPDGKPVHLFFLLVTPEDSPGGHLKVLARISRLMKQPGLIQAILNTGDRESIHRIIADEEEKIS